MTIPRHYHLRLSGLLFGGPANWSIGLRFRQAAGEPESAGNSISKLEDWRDAIKALNGGAILRNELRGPLSTAATVTTIRTAVIGADGKEEAVAIAEGSPLTAGSGSAVHPAQMALTVSLLTARPGGSYRGRCYLPGLGVPTGQLGTAGDNVTQAVATDFAAWLGELGNAGADIGNPQIIPVVLSTRRSALTDITRVRVGSRLDVQRRRADKEAESYAVAVVPQ